MASRCQATNQQGKPCGADHYRDGYCRWHHPDLEGERRAWSAKGGSARSNRARAAKALPTELMSNDELSAWLTIQFRKLITGQIEPGIATASATVAKAIAEIQRGAQVEERIAELEALLGTGKRPA